MTRARNILAPQQDAIEMNTNPRTEVFILNPYATNINPSSIEGGKLYMKATQELPANEKLNITIENGPKIRNHLEHCRSKFAWGLLLSKVLDDNGDVRDVIKNFRAVSKDNILAFNSTYLGNGQNVALPANRTLPYLDPANDPAHKIQFYTRARSQLIAQAIQCHFDQPSMNKLLTNKKNFTWYDNNGDSFYDGLMMVYMIMLECNPQTKVGVQILRDQISGTKSTAFSNDVSKMLEHIASTMELITDQEESHDNLMKDTFDALLTLPNTQFNQYFALEKLSWQGGTKSYTYETLADLAKSIYNNMIINGTWNAVDPKDAQIMALTTKVDELTTNKDVTKKPNDDSRPKYGPIPAWRKERGETVIEIDGLKWYWCENHDGSIYNKGLYVRHKPEDCRKKNDNTRRAKRDRYGKPDKPVEQSKEMKLTLQKGLKTALLMMGTFTEEQVETILQETQENLPKVF